jgi:integrase
MSTANVKAEVLPRGIRRRGHSLYAFLTHEDGQGELRVVGNCTVKFAQSQREKWQREILENKYIKKVPHAASVKFSDICDKAETYYKDRTRCWDAIECRVKRFKEWWGDRKAESITKQEIEERLFANVAPRGAKWSETTHNEYRVSLLRIFQLAIDREELKSNPVEKAFRYKLDNARDRVLSFAEEDALRAVIERDYPDKTPEFDLGLHLMCRHSNIYGEHNAKRRTMEPLQWDDVNLDFRIVSFKRSKSGKAYKVPVNETAMAALRILHERGDGTGPVIRKPKSRVNPTSGLELQSSRRWFENALAEAKIKGFRWHDLRHTSATRLREEGAHVEDIGYLLGHGNKSITERYAHPPMKLLQALVLKLDRKPETKEENRTNTGQGAVLAFSAEKVAS